MKWRHHNNYTIEEFHLITHCTNAEPLSVSACKTCTRVRTCRYAAVEKDCNTALALEEDYVKAYLRRGVARRHLGKFSEAIQGTCKYV